MKKFLFIGVGALALIAFGYFVFGKDDRSVADQIRDKLGQLDATTTGKNRDAQYTGTTTGKKVSIIE